MALKALAVPILTELALLELTANSTELCEDEGSVAVEGPTTLAVGRSAEDGRTTAKTNFNLCFSL